MKTQIRSYLDSFFVGKTPSPELDELKEELLANCYSRYDDLVAAGSNPQDAYIAVISGLGDVRPLIRELENKEHAATPSAPLPTYDPSTHSEQDTPVAGTSFDPAAAGNQAPSGTPHSGPDIDAQRAQGPYQRSTAGPSQGASSGNPAANVKSSLEDALPNFKQGGWRSILYALAMACGILMLVTSPILFAVRLADSWGPRSVFDLLATLAIAILILVFANLYLRPQAPPSDNVVDDFKNFRNFNKQNRKTMAALNSALWYVVIASFFVIGFLGNAWWIAWVVFPIGSPLIRLVLDLYRERIERRNFEHSGGSPEAFAELERKAIRRNLSSLLTAIFLSLFLVVGFVLNSWPLAWIMLFLMLASKHLFRAFYNI